MRPKRTTPEEQFRLITERYQSALTDARWYQQDDINLK